MWSDVTAGPSRKAIGSVVADAGAELGVETPAPLACSEVSVDGEEVLGALPVDGDRLPAERRAPADAAVEALPGLGGLEVGRELDRAGAAGDGDTGLLELDADASGGMTDERRRRVG